jgi:hypothetical protein
MRTILRSSIGTRLQSLDARQANRFRPGLRHKECPSEALGSTTMSDFDFGAACVRGCDAGARSSAWIYSFSSTLSSTAFGVPRHFDPIDTAAGPADRESAFGLERQLLEARPITLDDGKLRAGA